MMNAMRLVLISAVGLQLIACSSSSGNPDTGNPDSGNVDKDSGSHHDTGSARGDAGGTDADSGGGGSSNISSFCASLVSAEATLLSRCLGGPESSWQTQLAGEINCASFTAAETAGRITFSSTQAATCLSDFAGVSCSDISSNPEPAACTSAIAGTVAANGVCSASVDCSGSSFCSGLGGATGSCSGTCKALIASGQTCAAGDQCVQGYSCSGSGSALTCTATPTTTPANEGDACGYNSTTKTLVDCAAGLACNTITKVCVTPVQIGAACAPGAGVCELFSNCDPTSKTCKADPGLNGKCGAPSGQDSVPCAGPTYCKTTGTSLAGTCAALLSSGAACTASYECASGTCSGATDAGAGTCTAACTEE